MDHGELKVVVPMEVWPDFERLQEAGQAWQVGHPKTSKLMR